MNSFKKKIKSKNLLTFFNNLTGDLKKTIYITSKRYSDKYKDTLSFLYLGFYLGNLNIYLMMKVVNFVKKQKRKILKTLYLFQKMAFLNLYQNLFINI